MDARPSFVDCVDFGDLRPGSVYHVGDFFQDSDVIVVVQSFTWSSGAVTYKGMAQVTDDQSYMEGNRESPYMWVDNASLAFVFGRSLDCLSFRYAYWGGNINLKINGNMLNFVSFTEVDGQLVGGVKIKVKIDRTVSAGHEEGIVTLRGKIDAFSVGGQELAIDDVCPC